MTPNFATPTLQHTIVSSRNPSMRPITPMDQERVRDALFNEIQNKGIDFSELVRKNSDHIAKIKGFKLEDFNINEIKQEPLKDPERPGVLYLPSQTNYCRISEEGETKEWLLVWSMNTTISACLPPFKSRIKTALTLRFQGELQDKEEPIENARMRPATNIPPQTLRRFNACLGRFARYLSQDLQDKYTRVIRHFSEDHNELQTAYHIGGLTYDLVDAELVTKLSHHLHQPTLNLEELFNDSSMWPLLGSILYIQDRDSKLPIITTSNEFADVYRNTAARIALPFQNNPEFPPVKIGDFEPMSHHLQWETLHFRNHGGLLLCTETLADPNEIQDHGPPATYTGYQFSGPCINGKPPSFLTQTCGLTFETCINARDLPKSSSETISSGYSFFTVS